MRARDEKQIANGVINNQLNPVYYFFLSTKKQKSP